MHEFKKLSIVVPIYNERKTIPVLLAAIRKVELPYEKEVILIDDGSTDGSGEVLKALESEYKVILSSRNMGKGSAVRKGFAAATGDMVIIQDADMEYDPAEYPIVLRPILEGHADVVYGSRFVTVYPRRILYFPHYLANKLVTTISNIFSGLNLSDMETGFKAFTGKALKEILPCLSAGRFGIEPEITAQVAKHKLRVYEVGISYHGRTYAEGKKITWKDGLAAIWHIIRFNLFVRK
ncbi:MAG: glycosyltransferase family 2 protein [Candidatus Colwellbacteria bacterium]